MNDHGFMYAVGPDLESGFNILRPEPDPVLPEYIPEPDPIPEDSTPEPAPESSPDPDPEEPTAPLEVVTVEDLLDRLTGAGQSETEDPSQETEEEAPPEELPEAPMDEAPFDGAASMEASGVDVLLTRLETIQQAVDHPAMTTPFENYTVSEALLLLLFLSAFMAACVKMLKGGFAWLR